MERVHEQFAAVTTALCLVGQKDLCLAPEDKHTIENALISLKPFLHATEAISGQNYVSVSLIVPLAKELQLQYSRVASQTSSLGIVLSRELRNRFVSIETAYITAITTLLDPRFKKLPFCNHSALDTVIRRITNELASIPSPQSAVPMESNAAEVLSDSVNSSDLWASFDNKVAESNSRRSSTTDSMIELRRYFEEGNIDRKTNPLSWWQQNSFRFPKLQILARKYLCVPGSSVPSERLFSKAGQLVSERRSGLKSKNIDMMLFLNHNIKRN